MFKCVCLVCFQFGVLPCCVVATIAPSQCENLLNVRYSPNLIVLPNLRLRRIVFVDDFNYRCLGKFGLQMFVELLMGECAFYLRCADGVVGRCIGMYHGAWLVRLNLIESERIICPAHGAVLVRAFVPVVCIIFMGHIFLPVLSYSQPRSISILPISGSWVWISTISVKSFGFVRSYSCSTRTMLFAYPTFNWFCSVCKLNHGWLFPKLFNTSIMYNTYYTFNTYNT